MKFANLVEICLWPHLAVKGLNGNVRPECLAVAKIKYANTFGVNSKYTTMVDARLRFI